MPKIVTVGEDLAQHILVQYFCVLLCIYADIPTFAATLGTEPVVVQAYNVCALFPCQAHTAAVEPILALVTADHEPTTALHCSSTTHIMN